MRGPVVRERNGITELLPQLWILNRDGLIDGWVSRDVRRVVRQGAEREGELVGVLTLEYQLATKVSAADVMHQVAEFHGAKRIAAEVLDDSASIGIRVRFFDLVVGQTRIAAYEERSKCLGPE
jgi:hypothetical protein